MANFTTLIISHPKTHAAKVANTHFWEDKTLLWITDYMFYGYEFAQIIIQKRTWVRNGPCRPIRFGVGGGRNPKPRRKRQQENASRNTDKIPRGFPHKNELSHEKGVGFFLKSRVFKTTMGEEQSAPREAPESKPRPVGEARIEKQQREFPTVLTHDASERNRRVGNWKSSPIRKVYVCPSKLETS